MNRVKEVVGFAIVAAIALVAIFMSNKAVAGDDIGDVISSLAYHYNPPEFTVCANGTVTCKIVGKKDEFTLIHADGGKQCPAGYYFVANSKDGFIQPVIAPTCDPSLVITFSPNARAIDLGLFGKVVGSVPLDQ